MTHGDLPSWAKAWQVIDDAMYSVEKVVVTVFTVVMALSIFVAVTWTTLASGDSKLAFIFEGVGDPNFFGHMASIALWTGVCVLAAFTGLPDATNAKRIAVGVGASLLTTLFGLGLVELLPNGLIFAQRLALALLLWVTMLGCSMATYTRRHIALQAVQKIVPEEKLATHSALSLFMAACFAIFLAIVGGEYAVTNYVRWSSSGGISGTFDSIPIPYWTVTASIPFAFALSAVRLLVQSALVAQGHAPAVVDSSELGAAADDDTDQESDEVLAP